MTRIFDYASLGAYLNGYVEGRKQQDPHYSFRRLADEAGIKSAPLLSMIARDRRAASEDVLTKLATALAWKPRELAYARILVNMTGKAGRDRARFVAMLRELRLAEGGAPLDSRFIADLSWPDIVILEMTDLADFEADARYIERRTGGSISVAVADEVLKRLEDLGVLVKDASGKAVRSSTRLTAPENGSNPVIRRFHKDMLELASQAIDGVPYERRLMSGTTLTIRPEALAEANRLIAEFTNRLIALTHAAPGAETYHFAVQFFPVTKPDGEES